ncbi:MAG: LamG domain-containing protein, partial [Polyangiaceae bacterium]
GCSLFVALDDLQSGEAGDGGALDAAPGDSALLDAGQPDTSTVGDGAVTSDSPYVTTILADHPLGYWSFEETSGTTTKSRVPGGGDGTLVGAAALGVAGRVGGGISLDGVSSCVSIGGGNTYLFSNGHSFSVEAWVNPSKSDANGWLVSDELINPDPYPRYGWSLYIPTSLYPNIDAWNADVDSGAFIFGAYSHTSTGSTAAIGTWTQVVGTYDGASGMVAIYVNAVLRNTSGHTGLLSTHGGALGIGCRNPSSPRDSFGGSVDEVAVYDYALSLSQIQAHLDAADAK